MRNKKNIRKTIIQILICMFMLVAIWWLFFIIYSDIEIDNIKENDFSFIIHVENVENNSKKIILNGFVFKLQEDSLNNKMIVLLYDVKEKKIIYPKIDYKEYEAVQNYFFCEYNYLHSGFCASFDLGKYCLNDYEILVKDDKTKSIYKTGVYLSEGKITYISSENFASIDVHEGVLKEVVDKGKIRVCRPDIGMYIYQKDWDLYWIAEKKYAFSDSGATLLQYQMKTTQIEKLPVGRREQGYDWDNLSFYFEENEMEGEFGKYRVAKTPMPKDYSLSKIWVGFHDGNDWNWLEEFYPVYDL